MPALNAQVKRERSANLRQDRCCEVELQANATGENREGVCGVEAESEDLPVKLNIGFFGLKNDMILLNTGLVFEQDMIGRRSQSVLFFCFSLPQIPRGREEKPGPDAGKAAAAPQARDSRRFMMFYN